MDYIHGRSVIQKNNLVPRKTSKKIINFINFEKNFSLQKDIKISKFITYDKLYELRKKFQNFKKRDNINKPRNLKIYEFINKLNPNSGINYDYNKKRLILPEYDGIKLSLSTVLLSSFNYTYNSKLKEKINFLNLLKKLLIECNFKSPDLKILNDFYDLILRSKQNKKEIYIITPCCPDYSTVKEGDRYNFTFKTIENGIGLVAERLVKDIDKIHEFFKSNKIKFKHIITIGDFEAFSKKNLEKLNLTKKEFLKKTKINQKEIRKKFQNKMCFANKTFSEIFGDEKMWKKHINKFQTMINKGSFGYSELNNNILDDITKSRIALYKKVWQMW